MALTALLPDTLPKANPHSDYRIMLLPYYQNGADLGFVVAKRLMGIERRGAGGAGGIKGQCHYVANVERLADYMRLKYMLVPLE